MITIIKHTDELQQAQGEIRAGGTDIQARRRIGISQGPVVDISRLPDLNKIAWDDQQAATVGAHVTIDAISRDKEMIDKYPGLAMAAGALATPQIRVMASMGGALLQRTRCNYFRNADFSCFKKGGDHCPAREGDHRYGVFFDLGPCVFPHPSTLGMVLMAYEATVSIHGQDKRKIDAIYGDGSDPSRDHTLQPNELLTHIHLPAPLPEERASYFRSIGRARAEWPLVEAVVRLQLDDKETIRAAFVAVGGVANVPLRLPHVEKALLDKPATTETFEEAARKAPEGASPLPMTHYKHQLLYGTVLETLQRAYNRVWGGEG
ncbi:MAG: FAD binding domain-containing protein [Myxococcales bacterium]|nr:FAD binding domain-containing protein [Myxococcales bacterium]MCB9643976.1 FAD binding domain-containing protein [Myxococcales bacterium]